MRASARLKRYDAAWFFCEKVEQFGPADLLPEERLRRAHQYHAHEKHALRY